jgi:hypothetical protein
MAKKTKYRYFVSFVHRDKGGAIHFGNAEFGSDDIIKNEIQERAASLLKDKFQSIVVLSFHPVETEDDK